MKNKLVFLIVFICLILFGFSISVNAVEIEANDIPNNAYVIGTHIFTDEVVLTTQHIMLGATTINSDKLSDMIIYYKTPRGQWIDGLSGEAKNVPTNFEIDRINEEKILGKVEIIGKEYDGKSVDNEIVYKLKTDKEVGDGVQIYSSDTVDGEYTLVNINIGYEFIRVSVLDNTKKYFKIRPYEGSLETPADLTYGDFSEPIEIDQTNMSKGVEISNMEYGAIDENIITLTIKEPVGDGFTVYSSDTKDGTYEYEYNFDYTSEVFSNRSVNFTLRNATEGTKKYFKVEAYKNNGTTRVFSSLSSSYGILLQDIEITDKKFDGTTVNNEIVYRLITDKEVGDGVRIYSSDTVDGEYTSICYMGYTPSVDVLDNTKKYFKIRPYEGSFETPTDLLYGGFSEPIEIDQTNMNEGVEISNMEYGAIDENVITLTINDEVGDGFSIYSSDTKDGTYTYEYDFDYTSEQFSNKSVNFTLREPATGTKKYFKVKAYKNNGTTRVFSSLSTAYGLLLQNIEITSIEYDGASVDNEVVCLLKTDKQIGNGIEIYSSETIDGEYTLINTTQGYEWVRVSVLNNTKKYFKIRPYEGTISNKEAYGSFSEPIEIDSAYMNQNVSISNMEYGLVDENIITLTINEAVGDGFTVYSSDSQNGTYEYEYDFDYDDVQFSDNKVNFTLRNATTGTEKYFKVKAYRYYGNARIYTSFYSPLAYCLNFPQEIVHEEISGKIVITGKEFNGTTANNEIVYKLITNKIMGDGVQIYSSDTVDGEYTPVCYMSYTENSPSVEVLDNTKKYFKIRPYEGSLETPADLIYGEFSDPIEIDQTNMSESIEISNIEMLEYYPGNPLIRLTINEEVGDGFSIYTSDTEDGTYKYNRSFDYTSEQYANKRVDFKLINPTSNTRYIKIKAYKDNGTTRVYSILSNAKIWPN